MNSRAQPDRLTAHLLEAEQHAVLLTICGAFQNR